MERINERVSKLILLFALFIVVGGCQNELDQSPNVTIAAGLDSIVYRSSTYLRKYQKGLDDSLFISDESDTVFVLRIVQYNGDTCMTRFPLCVIGKKGVESELNFDDDNCDLESSNFLIFTTRTIESHNSSGNLVLFLYQEIGRSHDEGPSGRRYLLYSDADGVVSDYEVDESDLWPY